MEPSITEQDSFFFSPAFNSLIQTRMSSKSPVEDSEKQKQVLLAEAKDADDSSSQNWLNWLTRKLLTLGVESRGLENVTLFSIQLKPISFLRNFPGAFGRQSWPSLQQDILRLVFYELQHPFVSHISPD